MYIEFDSYNAAFEDDNSEECARILRAIAEKVAAGERGGNIRDINGNTIGTWQCN